ncbi:hypothetical protein Mgra_00001786 [Meloidogyne graminicola]|uniref:Tudor domain-containing protein n=1 Tax=Meloidogyne graminicola TaxID=189291 RepID=A0A8S9ZY68_9BILA|nr:hypothetical protein Mgra_00001786 [Meloidogyne graminicola]
MTHCNREPSPVLRRKEKERCMELLTDEEKVHRIDLRTPAICRLAHVESPNCVWFKLVNNISEDLRIIRPSRLEPLIPKRNKNIENCNGNQYNIILQSPLSTDLTSSNNLTGKKSIDEVIISEEEEQILKHQKNNSIQLYDYVLAPLEANVYARARIIQLKKINFHSYGQNKFKIFSYVHFIDEGFGVWLNTKCLAKMVPNMYTHPWQAFSVSLFRVKLGNGLDGLIKCFFFLIKKYFKIRSVLRLIHCLLV